MLLLSAIHSISVFICNSILQIITPDGIRGRTNTVNTVFIGTSNELANSSPV